MLLWQRDLDTVPRLDSMHHSDFSSPTTQLNNSVLTSEQQFYEDALCWLGRPREVYRLLSEAVMPPVSSWVRGESETRSFNFWQVNQIRPFLYPVLSFEDNSTQVMPCEALLLCGDGNYYNPCDVAIAVIVQQPQETFSTLIHRVRRAQALVLQGPRAMMTTEYVSLTRQGKDYINTKYLVWPHHSRPAEIETMTKQGLSYVDLSPADTARPFS